MTEVIQRGNSPYATTESDKMHDGLVVKFDIDPINYQKFDSIQLTYINGHCVTLYINSKTHDGFKVNMLGNCYSHVFDLVRVDGLTYAIRLEEQHIDHYEQE